MQVWQSVKAAPGHARGGEGPKGEGAQAGTVFAVDPKKPDEVVVKWDTDGVTEAVDVANLIELY
jgi:hypothetical protein